MEAQPLLDSSEDTTASSRSLLTSLLFNSLREVCRSVLVKDRVTLVWQFFLQDRLPGLLMVRILVWYLNLAIKDSEIYVVDL